MKKLLLAIFILLGSGVFVFSQNVQPYTELNTDKDDYAITFRSACDGVDMWLTNYRPGANTRSRRIVVAKVGQSGFQAPEEAPYPINQKKDRGETDVYLDGSPSFNACNPNYGVFTSNRLYNNKTYDNDLYEMRFEGGEWKVRRLNEVNSDAWDDSPSLSQDGKYLYFSSDRKRAGYGETDLYMATWLGDRWSSPSPLDEICELNVREQTPLTAGDGYLYYATDKSGDFDIWRAKIDQNTGRPIAGTQEPAPFEGVNKKGTSEGHPSFSPGQNWFIFSSNDGSKNGAYDLFYKQIKSGADTIYLKTLIRSMRFNKDFEEYEDAVLPYKTKLFAQDLYTQQKYSAESGDDGTSIIVLPRIIGNKPAQDRRIREIQVTAITDNAKHLSSTDTLLYELGYSCKLQHTIYVWDAEVLTNPECKQNFPITDVEFFITGYWCPTTKRFSPYADCQSVFPDPECMKVPEITQPCADNDLYTYKVNQPSIEKLRRSGLCANLSEVEKHGSEWSVKVDEAIVKFVDNVRSALKKPCIIRSLKKKKAVTIEVIGWTDPRQIDPSCLYTGKDIDFNSSPIKLQDIENKKYIHSGILRHNTKFRESANGGNQLLSEVRAYYTAQLLDNIWKLSLPEYAELRRQGLIEVVAVGKSIKPDQSDMARQRSVNVRILSDVEAEVATSKNRPELGSSIALCGNDCLVNLMCRQIERTSKVNFEDAMGELNLPEIKKNLEATDKVGAVKLDANEKTPVVTIEEKKDSTTGWTQYKIPTRTVKIIERATPVDSPSAVDTVSKSKVACYTIRYCSLKDENKAKELFAKLQAENVNEPKLTVYNSADGAVYYRISAGCYQTADDASSELRSAKITAKKLNLDNSPIVAKE